MYELTRLSVVSLATSALIVFASTGANASDPVLRNAVAAGATLHVRTISGFAHVTRGTGPATVSAHAHASDGNAIDMHVAESRSDGSWTVCEVPLAQKSCDERTEIDHTGAHATVDLTIAIPAGVKLDVASVSGDVAIAGSTAPVSAKTVSGNLRLEGTGDADVATVSGNIVAHGGAITSAKSVSGDIDVRSGTATNASFDSVSGGVKLAFPHTANLNVRAKTLSGDVSGTGLKFSGGDSVVGHDERATLGRGGNTIEIRTVSGSISVTTY